MPAVQSKPKSTIRHEEFCLPRPGADEPRVESYPYLDDSAGRSRPVAVVTRCIECGATSYDRTEK